MSQPSRRSHHLTFEKGGERMATWISKFQEMGRKALGLFKKVTGK